jgi:hypothetical protein
MSALAIRTGPCICAVPGCNRDWPRDPILDVACPDCHGPVGVRCKRPSGHSGSFVTAHAARDLAAEQPVPTAPVRSAAAALQPPATQMEPKVSLRLPHKARSTSEESSHDPQMDKASQPLRSI